MTRTCPICRKRPCACTWRKRYDADGYKALPGESKQCMYCMDVGPEADPCGCWTRKCETELGGWP